MTLALFLFAAMSGFGIISDTAFLKLIDSYTDNRILFAAVSCAMFILGFPLLFFGSFKGKEYGVWLSMGENGRVFITVPALTGMVERYLAKVKEISDVKINVLPLSDKTLKIELKLSAKPETDIPQAAKQIDAELREYIRKYSGVEVSDVEIRFAPQRIRQQITD